MPSPLPAPLDATCPGCRRPVQIPARLLGKSVRCEACGARFAVPADDAPPARRPRARPRALPAEDASPTRRVPRSAYGVAGVVLVAGLVFGLTRSGNKGPAPEAPPEPAVRPAPRAVTAVAVAPTPREAGRTGTPLAAEGKPADRKDPPKAKEPLPAPKPVAELPKADKKKVEPAKPPDAATVVERVKQSVALIQGKYGRGSGFLVAPDVVATNSHVVLCELTGEKGDVVVRFTTRGLPDEKGIKADLLYEDKARDLVFLRLKEPQPETRPPIPLAKDFDPNTPSEVTVVGSPGQGEPGVALPNAVEHARCDQIVTLDGIAYYRLAYPRGGGDIRIGRGNSGGPAVNARGELVGVLTRAEFGPDRRPTGKAYCIPADSVRSALAALGPAPGWGAKVEAATALHARDIATVSRHANITIACLFIELRSGVAEAGRGALGFDRKELLELGRDLTKAFQSADARFKQMAQPALQAALASKALTQKQKDALTANTTELRDLREIAGRANIPKQDALWAQKCEKRAKEAFEKFCKESGMSDEFVQMMVLEALREAGIDVQ